MVWAGRWPSLCDASPFGCCSCSRRKRGQERSEWKQRDAHQGENCFNKKKQSEFTALVLTEKAWIWHPECPLETLWSESKGNAPSIWCLLDPAQPPSEQLEKWDFFQTGVTAAQGSAASAKAQAQLWHHRQEQSSHVASLSYHIGATGSGLNPASELNTLPSSSHPYGYPWANPGWRSFSSSIFSVQIFHFGKHKVIFFPLKVIFLAIFQSRS